MLNYYDVDDIVDQIAYKDWQFIIHSINDRMEGPWLLQGAFDDHGELQKTRKWYISPHMTRSEVVQTVLAMILLAEEHEVRERFRYKGKKIYGPHFDADVLTEVAGKKANLDLRPDPVPRLVPVES